MKYKLDDGWIKLIQSASKTVNTAYDSDIDADGYMEVEDLLRLIEDLNYEVQHVQEELEDFKDEVEEYYKPRYRDEYDLYGVSPRDFM